MSIAPTTTLPEFGQPSFGLTKTLPGVPYDEALEKTIEALKQVHFGILTKIDLVPTFKAKLGTDVARPYMILGACNPKFAHQALSSVAAVGLLMPCNVVVTTDEEGNAIVSMVDPMSLFSAIVNEPGMEEMAKEVKAMLQTALDAL